MTTIMIDTCAWIDFLRSGESKLGDMVSLAIAQDQACLCGVIAAELLQGCKHKKEQKQLHSLLSAIPSIPLLEKDWLDCGQLMQRLRKKGITIPLTDALIATIAKRREFTVLTLDKHFTHLPVDLLLPPPL